MIDWLIVKTKTNLDLRQQKLLEWLVTVNQPFALCLVPPSLSLVPCNKDFILKRITTIEFMVWLWSLSFTDWKKRIQHYPRLFNSNEKIFYIFWIHPIWGRGEWLIEFVRHYNCKDVRRYATKVYPKKSYMEQSISRFRKPRCNVTWGRYRKKHQPSRQEYLFNRCIKNEGEIYSWNASAKQLPGTIFSCSPPPKQSPKWFCSTSPVEGCVCWSTVQERSSG